MKYQRNISTKFYINGIKFYEVANVTMPLKLDTLNLNNANGDKVLQGKTKSVQVYDYLSDAEMESLTGYDSYSAMTSQFNFNVL